MTDILNAPPGTPTAPVAPTAPVVDPATGQPAAPVAPVQPVTPPVAPVAAPVQPESTTDGKTGVVTYEATGDVGLDLALEFFGKLGLSFESPEMQEAGKGNFAYLEAKLAALGDKATGADRYLALAKDAHARMTTGEQAAYEARRSVAYDAVGGEETWGQIQEFVKANAEPSELAEVKAAMLQGGIVAKAMAQHLHQLYKSATGTVLDPADATRNQATNSTAAPISLDNYRKELDVLITKLGGSHRLDGTPEYKALRAKYANAK